MAFPEKNKDIKHSLGEYRPKELDRVFVTYEDGKRKVTCFCGKEVMHSIVPHFKKGHEDLWVEWKKIFVDLNNLRYSWKDIMRLFRAGDGKLLFSWTVIENSVKEVIESGRLQYVPIHKEMVKQWEPNNFSLEGTTVWDFPRRGDWAIHSGNYRGNWPPQIPRNLIIRYTQEGDVIIDAFAGGGTTLIEAWLLRRRSIGLDISKLAIQTMKANLSDMEELAKKDDRISLDSNYRPVVINANALELSNVLEQQNVNNVKLICAHPPYLDSIKYTISNKNDLALLGEPEQYYDKIRDFSREVRKILTNDGVCAILIGDIRKGGEIIPLGLNVLNTFISEGYRLDNIVIKRQNRDSSSEFWVRHRSNLLLMAHEYLFILRKA